MTLEAPVQATPIEVQPSMPPAWSMEDAWVGLGLAISVLLIGAIAVTIARHSPMLLILLRPYSLALEASAPTAVELVYVLPVIVILAWRRADWSSLGFRDFQGRTLAMGCAMTAVTYMAMLVYGIILVALKVKTQGDLMMQVMRATRAPAGYFIAAVIAAPFAEEVFFRGFFFQGLRQRFGWVTAMLLSSAVFASAHLMLVALLPTFLLGCVLAYVYHRSNSIWPGMIIHCLVNSFAMCLLLTALLPGAKF